jgi:hypothetical protein
MPTGCGPTKSWPSEMTPLEEIGHHLKLARARLETQLKTAKAAAQAATEGGVPEAVVARELGVDRMTIRKWTGKR